MVEGYIFLHFLVILTLLTITITGRYHHEQYPTVKAAYYPSWATNFPPAINTSLFTHIYYAFLVPNNITYKFEISNSTAIKLSNFTNTLHYQNPPLKALFSIGGTRDLFSRIASNDTSRRTFIDSTIKVARMFEFDGLDFDWEFPQSPKYMWYLGHLIQEWKHTIKKEAQVTSMPPLLLTAAVYFSSNFFSTYVNRSWSNITGPNASLFDPKSRMNTIYGLTSWIEAGMPREKIVMGLSLYGRTWELKDPNNNGIGAIAIGPGPGNGTMISSHIKKFIEEHRANVVYDAKTVSVYAFVNTTWIAFDDSLTITTKIGFAQALELRGYFFWALGYDKGWEISTQGNIFFSIIS